MKKTIFILIAIFVLGNAIFCIWYLLQKRNTVPARIVSPPTTATQRPPLAIPEAIENEEIPVDPDAEAHALVSEYIAEHISELSPEKEVLGGKFYITKITFENAGNAVVEYEDGHNAYQAHVSFILDGGKNVEVLEWEMLSTK